MFERLDRCVDDAAGLNSKLVLLIGQRGCGKTKLLNTLAVRRHKTILNVGAELGRLLLESPAAQRHAKAAALFQGLTAAHAAEGLVLLDNIELLFDRSLKLDPLGLLKQQARVRRMVATWPGELSGNRLRYATMGHPEYQEYGVDGVILLPMT
jgi:ABC-type lipoprotein export system ATPase subunit